MDLARLAQYALSTQDRPLRLVLDRPGGDADWGSQLLPQKVTGQEAICGGFEFRILCVAESAKLALKKFIGVPAELQIVTDHGQLRRFCGIVTGVLSGQSDGGLATYQLVMRDALSVMENRVNTRVFRDMSELDIIQALIAEWRVNNSVLAASFDLEIDVGLNGKLARREFTMQHNESDAAFVRRLMQRRGIAWFFRPGLPNRAGPIGSQKNDEIGHTLVLFDDSLRLRENEAGSVRFHRDAATEERDAITYWSAERNLQPGSVWLHSWDYKNPGGTAFNTTQAQSRANQGERGNQLAASLEDYYVAAPHLGDTALDLTELGNTQMAHYEYASKCFHGEGSVRDLAVGEWISLDGHPEIDTHAEKERRFVITEQRIVAQNNLPVEISARVERLFNRNGWAQGEYAVFTDHDGTPIRYKTRFSCVRRSVRIVPPRPILPRLQIQTAIVVGPSNDEVWCDKMGRVKVRFPATRPQDHAHAAGAGASDSDGDSAWVRVGSNWAGNGPGSGGQCGVRLLPPVGTEVLVDFAGGDPDKPIIVGQLYNVIALPPAFRREGALPATRYQSGIRSREVRGQRGNQLRFDDTPGQISAQLASDHATTELNMGYLTELRQDGRAAPRGEGAELRTDEAIALHAARGIFLSAWKLLGAATTKGGQLARDDFLGLMRECGELFASLGNYAASHNGLPIDAKEQDELLARFKKWEDGSNTAPKAAEPREPVIGVTSPAGIGFASSKAIVSYSAKNIDTVAQQHLQLAAGQRVNVNAGNGLSLFAQSGGINAIAHAGKLLLQSQHGDVEINADENVKVTATKGTVTIAAEKLLFVTADGSFFKLGDGPPVIGSKDPLKFHAPDFIWDGPETMSTQLPSFGKDGTDLQFTPHYYPHLDGGVPATGLNYKIESAAAASSEGSTDAAGKSSTLQHDQMHFASINLVRKDGQS
ncbi:type VI secretion system Vgr family protein [Massilia horti]|uniref:Type VI secretion system tip protein VgrG n=1 Tax=Massilia horti TaxID=2562153 RepID=A0A4Y9T692_9BURK|nr:type VI secretion system Vgr family protein [Massilia horti]TFW33655.1 type VI secretion system tip protein VgrG [Massilia horti]